MLEPLVVEAPFEVEGVLNLCSGRLSYDPKKRQKHSQPFEERGMRNLCSGRLSYDPKMRQKHSLEHSLPF
jgi:hypothetical protein